MSRTNEIRQVVHLVPALFGPQGVTGGAERYALELARRMAERVPVSLLTFGEHDRVETDGALRIRVIGNPWHVRGQESNPFSLRLLDEVRRADVVHCHQQHVLSSSVTALVCRLLGRRVFVSDLGGGGWDISSYVSTDHWYHGHLHLSQYSRQVFGHEHNPQAHVIYGGVDVEKFRPLSSERENRVLYVGRVLPHKGVNYLIEALPSGLPLTIIGHLYNQEYATDLRKLAVGKAVDFLSDCNDAELAEHYRKALCVVLPSVYKTVYGEHSAIPELLGQTLLEGMASETPVICTDVASMPEIVQDGVTGFIVPPNDPVALRDRLLWLRNHPELARRMGRKARQQVMEMFSWPTVVEHCLRIYARA